LFKNKVYNDLENFINEGYDEFYVGMALGFDSVCFNALVELRKKYVVKIIACLPCAEQDKLWNRQQKKQYQENLKAADETKIINYKYTPDCMRKRNEYMVDDADIIYAYIYKSTGGAYGTVKYAVENGKQIYYY